MHKVKKHWVVKSGVAGAMIVGSVGAPMVPHLAFAAETEEVDSGEETEGKSLADVQEESMQTMESTVPEAPVETVATETEKIVESESEDDSNNSTTRPDATTNPENQRTLIDQHGLNRAEYSSEYNYVAGEKPSDVVVFDKSSFKRILTTGADAPKNYTSPTYDTGLFFKFTVNGAGNNLKKGEKIFIPLNYESKYLTSGSKNLNLDSASISGLGQLEYVIGDETKANYQKNGYVLTLDQDFNETKIFSVSISGRPAGAYGHSFLTYYDSNDEKIKRYDVVVKFNDQEFYSDSL